MSPQAMESGLREPRFTLTRGERCHRRIDVEVPPAYFARVQKDVIREYAGRVRIRGFRKGRTPALVVMRQYGREIHEEALGRAARRASREAVAAERLTPVSQVRLNDLDMREDGTLTFNATFEALAEIPLGRLGGFRVERPAAEVPAGAVDELLDGIRRRNAAWHTADEGKPRTGDSVTVRVATQSGDAGPGDEEREYDLVLGRDQALPGIEAAIQTLEPGEAGEFDVAFPDDHPDRERAGTRHRLAIELVSRRVAELPSLDDDFARTVSDAESLGQLRSFLEAELAREAETRAEEELRSRLFGLVAEANPFDVPDALIDERLEDILEGSPRKIEPEEREKLLDSLRPVAESAVRKDLLVERILDEHDLRATESEVEEVVRRIAEQAGESPSAVRARLRKGGGLDRIWSRITDDRLFAFLKERSRIAQAPSTAIANPPTGGSPTGD